MARVKISAVWNHSKRPRYRVLIYGRKGQPLKECADIKHRPIRFRSRRKACEWAKAQGFQIVGDDDSGSPVAAAFVACLKMAGPMFIIFGVFTAAAAATQHLG